MPDLMTALRNAHAAGDEEAARRIAQMIKSSETQHLQPPVEQASNVMPQYAPQAAALESVAAIGSSGLLEVPAIVTELGAAAAEEFGVDASGARQFAKDIRGAAYEPKTDLAKQSLQTVGEFVKPVGDFFNKYVLAPNIAGLPGIEPGDAVDLFKDIEDRGFDAVADRVEQETGSPLLTEITRKTPEVIGGVIGGKNLFDRAMKSKNAAKAVIVEQIKSGNPNTEVVTKMLNKSGDVITNPNSKKAMKVLAKEIGDDRALGMVAVAEKMSPYTKTRVGEMLDIVDEVRKNPLVKQDKRVTDILGDSVGNRARALATKNKAASKAIGNVTDRLTKSGVTVDVSPQATKFMNDLSELGVTFQKGDDGWVTADLSRSKFNGGDQRMLNVLINDLAKGELDFKSAHELKRQIRDNVNYGVQTGDQVKGKSEAILKKLSNEINDSLRNKSTAYSKANDKFSSTIEAYEKLDKLAGKDIDLFSDLSSETLGSKAVSLLSNNLTRTQVKKALNDADKALRSQGVSFNDDIASLIHASEEIETLFKLAPSRSFGGSIEKAGANIAQGMTAETTAISGIYEKVKGMTEPDFNKKMAALRVLVESKPK